MVVVSGACIVDSNHTVVGVRITVGSRTSAGVSFNGDDTIRKIDVNKKEASIQSFFSKKIGLSLCARKYQGLY